MGFEAALELTARGDGSETAGTSVVLVTGTSTTVGIASGFVMGIGIGFTVILESGVGIGSYAVPTGLACVGVVSYTGTDTGWKTVFDDAEGISYTPRVELRGNGATPVEGAMLESVEIGLA